MYICHIEVNIVFLFVLMLNPPLSVLSDDLLSYIVDHVAELPTSNSDLFTLSITDRAFTGFCQAYILKDLYLGNDPGTDNIIDISKKLAEIGRILNDKPSFANRVRTVHLAVIPRKIYNDPNFLTIFQLLAKSLMPPNKLRLTGNWYSLNIEDPILVVERLMQSFFSQTLTVLDITDCRNVPLTLLLVCPNLRVVYLDNVEVFEPEFRDDEYPDTQCSGRRNLPVLERLNYRNSGSFIKQMITPPPKFSMAVVVWSKLRVLKLCPEEKEGMVYLQPILDAACNALEELYLTNEKMTRFLDGEMWSLLSIRHEINKFINKDNSVSQASWT